MVLNPSRGDRAVVRHGSTGRPTRCGTGGRSRDAAARCWRVSRGARTGQIQERLRAAEACAVRLSAKLAKNLHQIVEPAMAVQVS